ncbi:hypothetical protein SAMN05877838_3514 [Hoeflea halophila]|uniref:Uncharacterized protein n=1 Tax=Hoeflea halophila TaxID=714899 RepID=A0A286IEM9_9HYPH|nr:hypothetical protein [Hoeflea halophila]SOE18585.1 hypothetical protein SAMN05877838_3514 [Hoeflea halophila]
MNQMAKFPLPYENEEPDGDVRRSLSLIRIVQELLCKPNLQLCEKHVLDVALSQVTEMLTPVLGYLENDERSESLTMFQDARRRRTLEYGGKGE